MHSISVASGLSWENIRTISLDHRDKIFQNMGQLSPRKQGELPPENTFDSVLLS
jgi:hypothetical protein